MFLLWATNLNLFYLVLCSSVHWCIGVVSISLSLGVPGYGDAALLWASSIAQLAFGGAAIHAPTHSMQIRNELLLKVAPTALGPSEDERAILWNDSSGGTSSDSSGGSYGDSSGRQLRRQLRRQLLRQLWQ